MSLSRADGLNKSSEVLDEREESAVKAAEALPKTKSKGLNGLMKKISGKKEPEMSAPAVAASSSVTKAMDLEGGAAEPKLESSKFDLKK